MENELKQIKKLKLNAQNIKSTIFNSNNKLRKIKLEEKNIVFRQKERKKQKEEEKRLETPTKITGLKGLTSKIAAGPMSIFDKIKEFFGLLFAGILVNALPGIIAKINEFLDSDFVKNIKNFFENLGNGIMQVAKFVGLWPKSKRDELDKEIKELNDVLAKKENKLEETEIKSLQEKIQKEIDQLENVIEKKEKERDKLPQEDKESGNNQWWDFLNVFPNESEERQGKKPPQPQGQSLPQDQTDKRQYRRGNRRSQNPQKMAKGGTIKSNGSGPSQSRTPYARPEGSPKGRKARESIKTFDVYNRETKITADNLKNQEESNELFAKLADNFSIYSKLKEKNEKAADSATRPPGGGAGYIIEGGTSEEFKIAAALFTESGRGVSATDVLQVAANRVSSKGYPNTYQDVFAAKNQFEGVEKRGTSGFLRIKSISDAASWAGTSVSTIENYIADIRNEAFRRDSANFVGGFTEFRGNPELVKKVNSDSDPNNNIVADKDGRIPNSKWRGGAGDNQYFSTSSALSQAAPIELKTGGVTARNAITDIPGDLIDTGIKDYKGRTIRMKGAAASDFKRMAAAAKEEGVDIGPGISSSYRTKEENDAISTSGETSGHRKGVSFDINWFSPAGEWIRKNSEKFNFYFEDYKEESTHFNYRPGKTQSNQKQSNSPIQLRKPNSPVPPAEKLTSSNLRDPNRLKGNMEEETTVALAQQYVIINNERVVNNTRTKMVPYGVPVGNRLNYNMEIV